MIATNFIKLLLFIGKTLFMIIKSLVPGLSIPIQFGYTLSVILETTQQANNFIYFIMGDTAIILIPTLLLLIGYKYIAYPILNFILGIFYHKVG